MRADTTKALEDMGFWLIALQSIVEVKICVFFTLLLTKHFPMGDEDSCPKEAFESVEDCLQATDELFGLCTTRLQLFMACSSP